MTLLLIFTQNNVITTAASNKKSAAEHETMKDNGTVIGVVGAIIDNSSRIGKEEELAMKMAVEDFRFFTNRSLILHIIDCRRDPMHAALAGN